MSSDELVAKTQKTISVAVSMESPLSQSFYLQCEMGNLQVIMLWFLFIYSPELFYLKEINNRNIMNLQQS